MKGSVLVALSGGIDSAVSALLFKNRGFKVTGVHFNFFPGNETQQSNLDRISETLDVPIIRKDAIELFEDEMIRYFTRFHLTGLTPSSCAHCNPHVKYKLLLQVADEHWIENIATGHYIRLKKEEGLFRIYKGKYPDKDQSYYLWGLKQDVLSRLITPLGTYNKNEVTGIARKNGLGFLTGKKESRGLCFAQGRTCDEMFVDYIPDLKKNIRPGNILNKEGKTIGRHKGYIYYTVGQKRDLEVDTKDKLCVAKIDAEKNILVVEPWKNLYASEFMVTDLHWTHSDDLYKSENIQVIIRGFGLNPGGNCRLGIVSENRIKVYLDEPAWALAPGQPAVFYSGERLLGGSIIV